MNNDIANMSVSNTPLRSNDRINSQNQAESAEISEGVKAHLRQSLQYQIVTKILHSESISNETTANSSTEMSANANDAEPIDPNQMIESRIAEVRSSREMAASLTINGSASSEPPVQKSDPLILDLDHNGIQTSGIENGIAFDIDGDGTKETTSFVSGGDAFLALDRNGNRRIDSGKELFGDQNGAANGFDELRKFDDNNDGKINAKDAVYSELLLMQQAHGQTTLQTLSEAGVSEIDLNYRHTNRSLNTYDSVAQSATFTRDDGRIGQAVDVLLGQRKTD